MCRARLRSLPGSGERCSSIGYVVIRKFALKSARSSRGSKGGYSIANREI